MKFFFVVVLCLLFAEVAMGQQILGAGGVSVITDIAASLRTGDDAKLVTGTEGGAGFCAEWNADGDLVEAASSAACGSGGTTVINALGDATGAGAVAVGVNAEFGQVWTWNWPTVEVGELDAFTLQLIHDSTSGGNTQRGLVVNRPDSAGTQSFETGILVSNGDTNAPIVSAFEVTASTANMVINAFDASNPQITNALAVGENDITVSGVTVDATELEELATIDSTVISATDWALLAELDGGTPAINCTDCTNIPEGSSHTDTVTWGGTSILESGPAFGFGDGTDATLTHTYGNTGTDVVVVYSTNNADFSTPVTGTSFTADPSATPGMTFIDSDTTDGDVSVSIDINCTAPGTGAENCDYTIGSQTGGSDANSTPRVFIDGDGPVHLEGSYAYVGGSTAPVTPDVANGENDLFVEEDLEVDGVMNVAGVATFGVAPALPADSIDAITEIAAALKTGADAKVVTGTEGATGICAEWNVDGDLVAAVSAAACGTGGTVATDAIWDAKGDLAGGTGANTAVKLVVGANDTILTAASGETTGLAWTAAPTIAVTNMTGSLDLGTGTINGAVVTEFDTATNIGSPAIGEFGGKWFFITSVAATINLPEITASGQSACFYSMTAINVTLDTSATDIIVLNGTALAAGNSIDSDDSIGAFICLISQEVGGADKWFTLGRAGVWTDGGAT